MIEELYEDKLKDAPAGETFEKLYDREKLEPIPSYQKLYDEVKQELRERGLPFREILAFANIAAGLSCRGIGGRAAIPTIEEIRAAGASRSSPRRSS